MGEFTLTFDLKTLVMLGTLVIGAALGYATIKSDTSELRTHLAESQTSLKEANTRLAAVERQLVELTVTLRIKGVTP